MRKISHLLSLMIIFILCTSCTITRGKVDITKVDLTALNDNKGRYGLSIFRSIFFEDDAIAIRFLKDEHSTNLGISSTVEVWAKKTSKNDKDTNYLLFLYEYKISRHYYFGEASIQNQRFKAKETKTTEYNSGYFYTIAQLPAGEYYISGYMMYGNLEKHFTEEESPYRFSITADHVNYLGDFYFVSPKRVDWSLNNYRITTLFLDRSAQTKKFLDKFHPEVDLPFSTNLIKQVPVESKTDRLWRKLSNSSEN